MIDGKAAVMIAGTLAGAGVFSTLVYAWTKWIARPKEAATDDGSKLRQLEHTLEMIALEVERLGEAQRLGNTVANEHALGVASPIRGSLAYRPMITPH